MAFDAVYIGGGQYKHKADVLRVTPFAAFNGGEGIVRPSDCKVHAYDSPQSSVAVDPGVAAIIGRGPGQEYESYIGQSKSQLDVPIAATDSTGPRSDLIIVRVEDPYAGVDSAGDSWPVPDDPVVGPYIRPRVISGVPSGSVSVHDLADQIGATSAVTLARVDMPASASRVTGSMVHDLRHLADPRSSVYQHLQQSPLSVGDGALYLSRGKSGPQEYPQRNNHFGVPVPSWATTATIKYEVITAGVYFDGSNGANLWGNNQLLVNGTDPPGFSEWNYSWLGGADILSLPTAAHLNVVQYRGQTITVSHTVWYQGGTSGAELFEQNGTQCFLQVFFKQEPQ
jgi:hypothetical protein